MGFIRLSNKMGFIQVGILSDKGIFSWIYTKVIYGFLCILYILELND